MKKNESKPAERLKKSGARRSFVLSQADISAISRTNAAYFQGNTAKTLYFRPIDP
jgi:hypothetical protein